MKNTSATLIISIILVSAYAGEYDKEATEAPSNRMSITSLRLILAEMLVRRAMRITRRRRSLIPSYQKVEAYRSVRVIRENGV